MKTSKLYSEKSLLVIVIVSITFLFQACNPNEDTGENLVDSDIGDSSRDEIDIYVINENTLYGLRDNNRPSVNGNGTIEPFLIESIPGYAASSSPAFSQIKEGNGYYYEGLYSNLGLMVSSTDGILYNYDIPGGQLLWQTDLGGTTSATASPSFFISNDEGYGTCIGTNNGLIHFINADTGEIYTTYSNPTGAGFDTKAAIIYRKFGNSRLVVNSTDGWVYSFNVNGELITSYNTGTTILASPATIFDINTDKRQIIVGNQNGELFRLDDFEQLNWKVQLSGTIYAEPADGGENIYVSTTDGKVYQIDKITGAINWEFQAGGPVYGRVETSFSSLYFTSNDGSVYALNGLGVLQWQTNLGDGPLYSTPNFTKIREDQLYVNTINGMYGLNANTGEIFSNYTVTHSANADVSGNFKSSPAVFAFLK